METTNTRAMIEVEETTTSIFSLVLSAEIVLNNIVYDTGEGDRPFSPLLLKADGVVQSLPATLAAGEHVIELLGEPFSGIRLSLIGSGLNAVERITLGAVAELKSASPGYLEGDGHPDLNPAAASLLNGSEYWDRFNKQRYKKAEGTWLQLVS